MFTIQNTGPVNQIFKASQAISPSATKALVSRAASLRAWVLLLILSQCTQRKLPEKPVDVAIRICLARHLLGDGTDPVNVGGNSTSYTFSCAKLINQDGTVKK